MKSFFAPDSAGFAAGTVSGRLFLLVLTVCFVLTTAIFLITRPSDSPPVGFPDDREFRTPLRYSPGSFWLSLRDLHPRRNPDAGWVAAALKNLENIERNGQGPERNNALIARADLYFRLGYPRHGLNELNRAMEPPGEDGAATSYWWLKAELESSLGEDEALASTTLMLSEVGYERPEIDAFLSRRMPAVAPRFPRSAAILVWLVLLIGPALALALFFLRRTDQPKPSTRPAALRFSALRSGLAAVFIGTLLAWLFRLPGSLFSLPDSVGAAFHGLLSLLLVLIPAYREDRREWQTTWAFSAFVRFVGGWLLLMLAMPLTFFLSWLVLREMAFRLPFWALLQPTGPALGLPALSGLLLLGFPLILPVVLGWRRLSPADPGAAVLAQLSGPVHVWDIPGSRWANAVTIGYLSPTAGIAFTQPLLEGLTPDQVKAIGAHEEGHLRHRHLLLYFLFMFLAFLLTGFFAALNPMGIHRQLVFGPSLPFALALVLGLLLWTVLFASISRRCEREADQSAAAQCGREPYLTALTRLYDLNLLSEQAGQGAERWKTHPSLQERKQSLRQEDGRPFFPELRGPDELLTACWRSRLALEWKAGLSEAAHLVALEYEQNHDSASDRIANLALCHAGLGSECLVPKDCPKLEIILCAQKRAVRTADPNLPPGKVCLICREGVRLAMNQSFTWEETPEGCVFTFVSPENTSNQPPITKEPVS